MYVCMYVCMYVYIYIYIYTHIWPLLIWPSANLDNLPMAAANLRLVNH